MRIKLEKQYGHIHFIGIGGIHMSALAEMLRASGYSVSGTDQSESDATRRLSELGIDVRIGHKPENILPGTGLVVYTSAVKPENPEFSRARESMISMLGRAELLGMIMKNFPCPICVAGTHGKTTTTSMLGEIFVHVGLDPTILTGGILKSINSALKMGDGSHFIVESCEYRDNFLNFHPRIGIILNIEADHLDYFKDISAIRASFSKFAANTAEDGALIINNCIENWHEITQGLSSKIITFGNESADYHAADIAFDRYGLASFRLMENGRFAARVKLSVPGGHNVSDALAALASARICGVDLEIAASALSEYKGTARRFQYKGEASGIRVYDDYAHHPTEIRAAVAASFNIDAKKQWHIFQPHTRSRTKALLDEFADSLADAENIIVLDIYDPVGRDESHIATHSLDLIRELKSRGKTPYYFSGFEECADFLASACRPGDAVVTMGAGDVNRVGEMLLDRRNI